MRKIVSSVAVPLVLLFISASNVQATESAPAFSLDGRLYADVNGTNPLSDSGTFTFQILDPAESCVLYEETQPFDTTASDGYIHALVGSRAGSPKRTGASGLDVGHGMTAIYSNATSISGKTLGGAACTYVPADADARHVRVTLLSSSDNSTRTLSPNLVINSAPTALVAETLAGFDPTDALRLNTAGNPDLTQANVENVFQNYAGLMNLIDGTSTAYLRTTATGTGIGTTTPQAALDIVNTGTIASAIIVPRDSTTNRPSVGVNGMLRYNSTLNVMEGFINGGWQTVAAADGTSGGFLPVAGGTLTGPLAITGSSTNALVVGPSGLTAPVFKVDSSASGAAGVSVVAGNLGSGATVAANSSATNEILKVLSKGSGDLLLGSPGLGSVKLTLSGGARAAFSNTSTAFTPGAGPTGTPHFAYTGPADTSLTASTEAPSVVFGMDQTRSHDPGGIALQRDFRVSGSTHAFTGASVMTNAAAFSVDGPPAAGTNATITNAHGILIPVSAMGTSVVNSYGLTVNATTGATNNYAAAFLGGSVGIGTSLPTASLSLGGTSDQTINVVPAATGVGRHLTVAAGNAATGIDLNGGSLVLSAGTATGNGSSEIFFQSTPISQGAGSTIRPAVTHGRWSMAGLMVGAGVTPAAKLHVYTPGVSADKVLVLERGAQTAGERSGVGFYLRDSAANTQQYAAIFGGITSNVNASEGGFLSFETYRAGVSTEAMRIESNGFVGIGTAVPANALDVNGAIAAGTLAGSAVTSGYIVTSGRLGIGTASPASAIDTNGSITFNGGTGLQRASNNLSVAIFGGSTAALGASVWAYGSTHATTPSEAFVDAAKVSFRAVNAGATKMVIDGAGNVGIGVPAPTAKLQVAGTIAPSVDNTYTLGTAGLRFTDVFATSGIVNTSDARQKTNVRDSDLGLGFILRLRPVSYRWRSGSDPTRHYGLIAQEIERMIHEVQGNVGTNREGTGLVNYDRASDRYGLRYTELIAPIIRAVQELDEKLAPNERLVATLKGENATLRSELEAMRRADAANTRDLEAMKSRLDRIEASLQAR